MATVSARPVRVVKGGSPSGDISLREPVFEFHPALPLPCVKCNGGYYAGVSPESLCTGCGASLSDYGRYCFENFVPVSGIQHEARKRDDDVLRRFMRLRRLTSALRIVAWIGGSLVVAYLAAVAYRFLFPLGPFWLALLMAFLVATPCTLLLAIALRWWKEFDKVFPVFRFGDSFNCRCCGHDFHIAWRDNSMPLGTAICPRCRRLAICSED